VSLDELIAACLPERKYRAPSGQLWIETHRDERFVTLVPEYPCGRRDSLTMPLEMLRRLQWEEVE